MKHTLRAVCKRLPLILFALAILFSVYTAHVFTYHLLDSDAASELVLADFLADQNKIITTDWFYSTEIRLFNSNLIYLPLMKLFSDWQLIRFISILLFLVMLAGSYFYLSRRMKISLNAYYVSAALMLLPQSVEYGRVVLYHNYYTPCFIYGFLIAGLYLSFIEHHGQRRLWQGLHLFTMLALAFMSCLNGFRQLPATIIPLLLTAAVSALKSRRSPSEDFLCVPKAAWRQAGTALAVFLAGSAGLLINTFVLSRYYAFREYAGGLTVTIADMDQLRVILLGLLSVFGFEEGRPLFSAGGLIALVGLFSAVALLAVSFRHLLRRERTDNWAAGFMIGCYSIAMLTMTVIFLLLPGLADTRYYVPAMVWCFPLLGILIDQTIRAVSVITVRHAFVWLLCLCLAVNGAFYNLFFLHPGGKQVQYCLDTDLHTAPNLEDVVDYLEENKCDVGYSTHWFCNIITEMTNGRITMIPIERRYPTYDYLYGDWLTSKAYREISFVEDQNIFVLLNIDEADYFGACELASYAVLTYDDGRYRVYEFDFSTEVWDYLLQKAVVYGQISVLDQLLPQEGQE